jgi:hypothetical protein
MTDSALGDRCGVTVILDRPEKGSSRRRASLMTDVATLKMKIYRLKNDPDLDGVINCLSDLTDLVEEVVRSVNGLINSKK